MRRRSGAEAWGPARTDGPDPAPPPGRRSPSHVVAGYAVLGLAWAAITHTLLHPGPDRWLLVEGALYVAVTAAVLWWVLARRDRSIVAHERQLAGQRSRVEALAEDYGHGTIVVQDRRITFASSSVGAMVGIDAAALLGLDPFDLLHPDDAPVVASSLAEVSSAGQRQHALTARLRAADGTYRWVRGVLTDHRRTAAVQGVVINLHDVDDLQRREQLIASLLRGATAIAEAPDETAVCEAFLRACVDATGVRLGVVRLVDGEHLRVVASVDGEQLHPRHEPLPLDGASLGAQVARDGGAVVLETPEEVAALDDGAVPTGVAAACYVPMAGRNGCVGYLGLAAVAAHRFDPHTRGALATFAQQAALAVERVRLEAAQEEAVRSVTQSARRAAAVHRVTEAFSRAVRVDDVLEAAVRSIDVALRPDTIAAVEVTATGTGRMVQGGPVPLDDAGVGYPFAARVVQDVCRAARSVWFDDAEGVRRALAAAGAAGPDLAVPWVAGCCVPMRLDGEVVGVLVLGWRSPRPWAHRERRLVEVLATLCAEAIRRARLHDAAEAAAERHRIASAQFEALFLHHPLPLFVYDLATNELLAVNEAMLAVFGYERATDLIGSDGFDLLDPPGRPAGDAPAPDRFAGPLRLRMRRRDGSTFVAECWSHSAAGFAGRSARVVACIDQTARIAAEEERRRLEARMVAVAEEERRRVAEDLHDGPVQGLSVAAMWLTALRQANDRGEAVPGDRLAEAERGVITTIDELRTLMLRLYPPTFDQLTLSEAIRDAVSESPVLADLEVEVEDNLRRQPTAPVKAALYRVVLEALANVRKHAGVRRSTVQLADDADVIDVRIIDHGVGIDLDAVAGRNGRHLGLTSMRDRVAMVGGDCRVEPLGARGGTVVRATVPLPADGERAH